MNLQKHWAAVLDDYVIDLAWSPDGAILAAASAAGEITLFDAATGTAQHKLAGHKNGANCLAWRPVGRVLRDAPHPATARPEDSPHLLATGGQDGFVRFWDGATGQQTAEVKLDSAWVEHLAWRPVGGARSPSAARLQDSPCLFASAGRKLVALAGDGKMVHAFKDAPKTISALAWRPDGSSCAASCFGHVGLWDATSFAAQKEFVYSNSILALVWSPNGRWLVAGCQDNAVHLWAPDEDIELHMSGYEAKLQELSFSPDSKWLATGGGRDACVWDCAGAGPADREPLLLPHEGRICAVAFQHRQNVVATAAADGEFRLWAPTQRNPLVAEVKLPCAATKFAWRGDDSLLAAGTENGTVFVFKL
jgi:WD40 repeat protein